MKKLTLIALLAILFVSCTDYGYDDDKRVVEKNAFSDFLAKIDTDSTAKKVK